MNNLGYEPDMEEVKIAQITLAFHNEKVINWLRKRGTFIKMEKWDKVDTINDQISEALKDGVLLDKLQTPCSVFATFESEEGYNRGLEFQT